MSIKIEKCYKWEEGTCANTKYWYIGTSDIKKIISSYLYKNTEINIDLLKLMLRELSGNYAILLETEEFIFGAVDKIRSYPIYYFYKENNFQISNSARILRDENRLYTIENLSLLEFQMAGYVTGCGTLFKHLFQLQAGELLIWNKNKKKLMIERYYLFYSEEIIDDENALIHEFDEINDRIFKRIIEKAKGAPIYVPLSGGLDSRLVLCKLKQLKYDNLITFSYGPKGNYDAKWAEYVATKVNVPWYFIPYNTKEVRLFFDSRFRKDYWSFASGLVSLPFMVDELALYKLQQKMIIKENAIFINGQSGDFISGGHSYGYHQKVEPWDPRLFSYKSIIEAIFNKHFTMNSALISDQNMNLLFTKIKSTLNLSETKSYNIQELIKYYELWEWQERQAKLVVNGQRSYDYFGYKWSLPLWDDEYLDFWMRISYSHKFKQYLYKAYLDQVNWFGVFKNFKPVVWNWQRLSLLALPVGAILKRVFGPKTSETFYHYASYFGKYHHHFAPFGFAKWVLKAKYFKNPLAFYIETFLKEEKIINQ